MSRFLSFAVVFVFGATHFASAAGPCDCKGSTVVSSGTPAVAAAPGAYRSYSYEPGQPTQSVVAAPPAGGYRSNSYEPAQNAAVTPSTGSYRSYSYSPSTTTRSYSSPMYRSSTTGVHSAGWKVTGR